MKVTMTKIWIAAGFLAVISIAQANYVEPANDGSAKKLLDDSNPYFNQK